MKKEFLWKNQINERGTSRVWRAQILLKDNSKRVVENTSARSYEEACAAISDFTNFKEFLIDPYIIQ